MRVKQIGHYNLRGSRLLIEKVKQFYMGLLGFTAGFRPDLGGDGEWLYIDDAPLLHLTVDEAAGDHGVPTGNFHHIALDCEGLATCLARLKQKNVGYDVAEVPELDMTQIFVTDPAGVRIELNFVKE